MLLEQILGHDDLFRFIGENATALVYIIGGVFYLVMGLLVLFAIMGRSKNKTATNTTATTTTDSKNDNKNEASLK